jgi:chromate transporter
MIIPLIAQALWKLGRKAIKNTPTILVALLVMAGAALGQSEIFLLLIGGIGLIIFQAWQERSRNLPLFFLPLGTLEIPSNPTPHPVNAFSVFAVFLKIGSVLYGGGYVLVAFLQTDLVNRLGWLTSQQLLDAIAIGQITPGPLFTTATFIGYLLAGNGGAIAATVGIFLPSFILVLLVNPWVGYLRRSARFSAFLNGVNAGAWGLMMTTTLFLAHSALIDPVTIGLAIVGAICLWGFSLKSHWLVLIGMAVGIYLSI